MTSEYYKTLDDVHKQRYEEKLTCNDGSSLPDPLDTSVREHVFKDNPLRYPHIEFGDIYIYLVETKCFYTREAFKSYKMTDGYNFFLSGKIKCVIAYSVADVCVLTADVESSQTVKRIHRPWTVVQKSGSILSAHCTCMAGLGEACSHIAALLFAVESAVKEGLTQPSCTSLPCKWKRIKQQVQPSPVANIHFYKPEPLKTRSSKSACLSKDIKEASREQLCKLKEELKICSPNAVFWQLETSSSTDTADSETSFTTELYNENNFPATASKMYGNATPEDVLSGNIEETMIKALEKATRMQVASPLWTEHRKGRITASMFGKVMACQTGQEGIVSEIMGYQEVPLVSSLKWGRDTEAVAKVTFTNMMKSKHAGLEIKSCGLVLDKNNPFLGASPDGLVKCNCCVDAVLEIKCPESIKNCDTEESFAKLRFLDQDLRLKKQHAYYCQVQGQMAICGIHKAYFVVYTKKICKIIEIEYDDEFWQTVLKQLQQFFVSNVLPEIQNLLILKKN